MNRKKQDARTGKSARCCDSLPNDKRYLQPVSHGLAFVGSYIKPKRVYLSNRTLARFEERAVGFSRLIDGEKELTILDCKRIEQVINSYLGFCKGKRTYKRRKEILGMMGKNFFQIFLHLRPLRKYQGKEEISGTGLAL